MRTAARQVRDRREPKRLHDAAVFLRRRGHQVAPDPSGRHQLDGSICEASWVIDMAVAEGFLRPGCPSLRDASGAWINCPWCGEPAPEVRVHGHTQCKRCHTVIERCCDV